MAGGLIEGAVLGVVFQQTYKGGVRMYKVFRGSAHKEFEETVKRLLPTIKEICHTSSGVPSNFSLQKFQQFHDKIIEGNRLIDECQKSCFCFRSCRVAKCIKKLEKDINEFIRIELPFIVTLQQIQAQTSQSAQTEIIIHGQNSQSAQMETVIHGQNSQSVQLETVIHSQNSQSAQLEAVRRGLEQLQHTHISQEDEGQPPDPPHCLLGFDILVTCVGGMSECGWNYSHGWSRKIHTCKGRLPSQ